MKKPESSKDTYSRRSFIKSVTLGAGAMYLLGKVGSSLTAQDIEVHSDPRKAKGPNEPIGLCRCGTASACGGSGGGGSCQCGTASACGGSGG